MCPAAALTLQAELWLVGYIYNERCTLSETCQFSFVLCFLCPLHIWLFRFCIPRTFGIPDVHTTAVTGKTLGSAARSSCAANRTRALKSDVTPRQTSHNMDSRNSSASAVKFEGITCDNCGRREILGTRWKCELCFDYDLCDDCYKRGMHYRDHPFLLLKRPDEAAERVPPRTTSGRVPSSPISESGLIFYGITCDACGKDNISGVRWMCDECFDYDLCSVCYAANKHDNHAFVRFDRPRAKGIKVSPRKMSAGVESGGVVHEGIICDACGERGIYGTRWKCLLCFDFDLCNACYARGRHDQEHAFLSLEKPGGVAKTVPPRKTTFMPQVCYLKPGGPRFDCVSCNFCHDSCSGPRWKCEVCTDYDLCSNCYLSNVHDLDHAFVRFDGPRSRGVRVRPRHQSTDTEELEAMLHEGIRCDACGEAGIYGKRWKCQFCYAYDLCTACYMSGKHNGEHPFLRIDRAGGVAVKVPPREPSGRPPAASSVEAGFTFYGLRCDGCDLSAFSGARWKCDVCDDYDLCTACYVSDKHNVGHFFVRYDSIFEEGIRVDPKPETPAPNTAGICHKGINCDGCDERGIIGTRWKCELCYDFDLCTTCYASGKHEQEHSFLRVNRPGETAINVNPRKRSTRLAVNHLPRGGVRFHGISCNACGMAKITGTRWKCGVCANYNMCSRCYLSNKHNSEHSFVRFDRPRGPGTKVSAKQASPELDASGIAQEDVQFKGITCDVCGERDIIGTRWKCVMCHDYDLCTTCYAGGKHELSHAFLRFEVPGGRGLSVPPRQQPLRRTQPECTVVEDKFDKEEESRKEEAPSPDGDHPAQAELETKLRELEITVQCVICMERRRDVAFLCGHSACSECASSLTACHMCRVPITRRITLY